MREGVARFSALARVSVVVGALLLLSRLLGFFRELLIAERFGASGDTDAFYLIFAFVIGPASAAIVQVPRALVAAIHERESSDSEGRVDGTAGHRLAGMSLVTLVSVAGLAAILVSHWAEPLVVAFAPGFAPEDQSLCVRLLRLSVWLVPLGAASGSLAALSQSRGHFYLVQSATLWCNLLLVAGLLIGGTRVGVEAAVWGALAGGVLQLFTLLIYPFREKVSLRPDLVDLRPALSLVGAVVVLYAISQSGGHLFVFVDRLYAAKLPEGQLSCIGYAHRLMAFPVQLVWGPLSIVLLPAFSAAAHSGDSAEMGLRFGRAFRILLLILVLPMAVIAALGHPIVELVYGRGAFDAEAVRLTGSLLALHMPTVLASTVTALLATAFLAHGNVRLPVAFGLLRVAAIALLYPLVWQDHEAQGLVVTLGAVDMALMFLMAWASRRQLGLSFLGASRFVLCNLAAAALGVASAAALWYLLADSSGTDLKWWRFAALMISIGGGLAAGGGLLLTLRVSEARELPSLLLRTFLRRGSGD